jgi:hypothetical protein
MYTFMKKILLSILISLGVLAFAYAQSASVASGSAASSVAPRPLYICPNINSNLYSLKKGEEVRQLQQFIFNYYNTSVSPTGYFGPSTKWYVQKFQKDNGVNATGYVGQQTRDKIKTICESGGSACTEEYAPVCGEIQSGHECCKTNAPAYCQLVKVACAAPVQQTYGNRCELKRAGASFVKSGTCSGVVTNEPSPQCKIWYDGCNTCSRSYVGGPLMCTMMACIQGGTQDQIWANRPQCREYFGNVATEPVVKSFTGPVQLAVGEKGIWRVEASVYNNQPLTYNITWGDEVYAAEKMTTAPAIFNTVVQQNTSFEHSYANAGTYTVTITVRSQTGEETKTTATVKVANSYIKCLNEGVSYDEGASLGCVVNANGYRTCIADASYICRSGEWKIEGGLWYRY